MAEFREKSPSFGSEEEREEPRYVRVTSRHSVEGMHQ